MDLSKHCLTIRHQTVLMNLIASREFRSSDGIHEGKELKDSLQVLSTAIQQSSENQERLRNQCTENERNLKALAEDSSVSRKTIEDESVVLQKILNDQQISQNDIVSIQEKISDMNSASTDGTLIWRITNVKQRIGK